MRTVVIVRQRKTGKQIHEYSTDEDCIVESQTYSDEK